MRPGSQPISSRKGFGDNRLSRRFPQHALKNALDSHDGIYRRVSAVYLASFKHSFDSVEYPVDEPTGLIRPELFRDFDCFVYDDFRRHVRHEHHLLGGEPQDVSFNSTYSFERPFVRNPADKRINLFPILDSACDERCAIFACSRCRRSVPPEQIERFLPIVSRILYLKQCLQGAFSRPSQCTWTRSHVALSL